MSTSGVGKHGGRADSDGNDLDAHSGLYNGNPFYDTNMYFVGL